MLERFVNVLYWSCNVVAGIAAIAGLSAYFNDAAHDGKLILGLLGVFAIIVWLFGRGARYIALGK